MWWENEFLRVKKQRLYLGRRSAVRIAEQHGTPLFVYSRSRIRANFERLYRSLTAQSSLEPRICYAMKANPNLGILRVLRALGAWIDAVSPGEIVQALRAGFPPQRIIYTGTSVSADDILRVFRYEGITFNIDALEQLALMEEIKRKKFRSKKQRVCIRWNPGLGRGFNPRVVTAGEKSSDGTPIKFGVEEKKVLSAFERAASAGFLPVGLHQHLGSGWTKEDLEAVKAAVDRMVLMAARVEKAGFRLEFLDFGGGFGPKYLAKQGAFPVEKYIAYICRRVAAQGLGIDALAVEPGKYLVADAGVLLLKVEYIKESYGHIFACVNAGTYSSLPRPVIYPQARHEIVNCSAIRGRNRRPVTVAGNLCETGDVFGTEIPLPPTQRGDILAALCAGAYARSMASNFNLRENPREILMT